MKTISKILYGLISFSVFAAYKIETAWAGWKATLVSYSYGCSSSYTGAQVHSQLSQFQAQKLTLCQQNQLLKGCTYTGEDGSEQFMNAYSNGDAPGISSLIPLAELCNLKTAECMDCMENGTMDLSKAKSKVDNAIKTKGWYTFWAHDFSEFSKSDMEQLLEYIEQKGKDKVEVVTWNYMYNTFGNYTGPQVPTKEAILSVCTTQGHDLKNGTVVKPATCLNGPTMEGKCARCGETGTSVSKLGATGHKFENYVCDNNATCTELATKTAKCSNEGCKETDTQVDFESDFKHDLKTIVIKEATDDADGEAELKCSLCGRVVETVVIPKGKDADDVVVSKPEEDNWMDGITPEDEDGVVTTGKSKPLTTTIIIVIVASVLLLAGIGVCIFFIIKKAKN